MRSNPTTRRGFLGNAGALAAVGISTSPQGVPAAVERTDSMRITKVEAVTFRRDLHIGGGSGGSDGAEFFWVRLHTDKGIVGTGETYPYDNGQVGALKDYSSELELIGRDPRDIDGIWRDFYFQMAMRNAGGADMRVLSALNMAQFDILGQAAAFLCIACSVARRARA
jgi:L-alanine-DL-glutamate epimerase-like enolase superfamily enzyme